MKKINLSAIIAIGFSLVPTLVRAAEDCGHSGSGVPNPTRFCSLLELIIAVMKLFLGALAVFGTFMFMYGGFLFLSSGGNSDRIEKGKTTLFWSGVGIVVALGSWVLIKTIINATTNATF